ncbi:MAG: hypothetical protein LAT68_13445 [Cyclobacteriaceae bacterium]|nr:hypothetical protein [Cyclobacteriaceae bacterium]MCH8517325.1 hypothetical protein [Cyclobacteriaceae bacterium]
MKLIWASISLFILFLAVKPGLEALVFAQETDINCCSGYCAAENAPLENPNSQDTCDGEGCHPFQKCNSHFFKSKVFYFQAKLLFLNPKKNINSFEIIFKSYLIFDLWQPPKIA